MVPGYACPVCGVHEADAVHLANHLAVTASLGREDHLAWLAEHAPDWADCGPEELGERVADDALEVETPSGPTGGSERARPAFERDLARRTRQPGRGAAVTDETDRVLEEARELTRRLHDGEESGEETAVEDDRDASENE